MINKNDIVFSIIGFVFMAVVCIFCLTNVKYECPSSLYTLDNKTCILNKEYKYNELTCSNNGYFNGSKCVNVQSSKDLDLDNVCSLNASNLVANSRIIDTKITVENNNCVYNITYVPTSNVLCPSGFTLDNDTARCKKQEEKFAIENALGELECSTNEQLVGDKCIFYQYADPVVDKCLDEDTLSNNKCLKKYTDDKTTVCEDGTYLDNSCKILGNNQYSICPTDFTDTGYSCSKKEEIEATKK